MQRRAMIGVGFLLMSTLLFAGAQKEKTEKAEGKTAEKVVTLDISTWQWNEPGTRKWWHETADKFENEYPDIKIKRDVIPYQDYFDQMTVRLQAGNPPDVVIMGGSLHSFIVLGKFEPLENYMRGTGILERYSPSAKQFASRDGHVYQLPYQTVTYSIFYNKAMFRNASLDVPRTKDELIQDAKKLTLKDSSGNVIQYGYSMQTPPSLYLYYTLLGWIEAFGGHYSKDGKCTINSPAVAGAASAYKELYDSGTTPRRQDVAAFRQLFGMGKAAMIHDVIQTESSVRDMNPSMLPDLDAFIVPGGKGTVLPFGYCIAKDSKYKEEAWKWLAFTARPERQIRYFEITGGMPGLSSGDLPADAMKGRPWLKMHMKIAKEGVLVTPPGQEIYLERYRKAIVDAMAKILFEDVPVQEALNAAYNYLQQTIGG